ncbi:unnamed protein product [Spirodela intermedia]|uniref:Thioredoxin domain-containing protein n=1 Tax=Spirodela intermedia TaxID=51605 RepID=A0A7I8J147_SPIIN|nr:unnamed protein product [Spirodela intermedia]CAA6663868.1 unnamed protein product [Spirodela intermedia]
MALETCFQVSTVAHSTTAAAARNCIAHPHKLSLPASRARRSAAFSLSPSLRTSGYRSTVLAPRRGRGGRVVCQSNNAVAEVLEVTEGTWDDLVINNNKLVLVDFWAPWCGPCRMIEPVISELAKEYAGQIVCVKLNTDVCPNLANQFGIRSIPTVLLFKGGERKESVIGAVPKLTLSAAIDKYLLM